jgi:hypothetical protein
MISRNVFLLTLIALPAFAQPPVSSPSAVTPPPVGRLVRAWRIDRYATPRYVRGPFVGLTPDSVIIQSTQRGIPIALPLDSVARFEFASGREGPGRNMLIGAGVGGAIGAAGGATFAFMVHALCEGDCPSLYRFPIASALAFAVPGAIAGSVVGGMFPGRHVWDEVPVPPRR